jgi:hypothetical protein
MAFINKKKSKRKFFASALSEKGLNSLKNLRSEQEIKARAQIIASFAGAHSCLPACVLVF